MKLIRTLSSYGQRLSPIGIGVHILLVLLVLGMIGWGGYTLVYRLFIAPRVEKERAANDRLAIGSANAHTQAAIQTMERVDQRDDRHDRLDITVRQAQASIAAAPGASDQIGDDLDRRGRAALCLFRTYSSDPACAGLLAADPAQATPGDAGGTATR